MSQVGVRVVDFIEFLEKVENKERLIVLSSDSEGNRFSEFGSYGLSNIVVVGKFGDVELCEDTVGVPALIIYPNH